MNSGDRQMPRLSSGGDGPEPKQPDLAWCAAGAIALVTGVEVGSPGPCRGADVAGEQLARYCVGEAMNSTVHSGSRHELYGGSSCGQLCVPQTIPALFGNTERSLKSA